MAYTYPPPAPTSTANVNTIHALLANPTLVARRVQTLLQQRYISDALLTGRFQVNGGAIQVQTGESIFVGEDPRAVPPGGEYPLVTMPEGSSTIVKTVKWGEDTEVTDEAIKRLLMSPVNKGLTRLANQNVKYVDSVALSAISTAVTATAPAAATWATATAAQILRDVLLAKANIVATNQGFEPDTVVIDDINWAYALSAFVAGGYVPREAADNPALTGEFPIIAGMRWLATPNVPTAGTALVLDSDNLGGMADEDLGGPGYVSAAGPNTAAVQVKVMREDEEDKYRLRARRVTVPVILEPGAARKITGL